MGNIKVLIKKGGDYGRSLANQMERCNSKRVACELELERVCDLQNLLEKSAVRVVGSCLVCQNHHFPHCDNEVGKGEDS